MTARTTQDPTTALDDLFAAARAEAAAPASPDFLARVLADAYDAQPDPAPAPAPAALAPPARPGLWARASAAFGGGFALAGMGTAGIAGLWLGFAPPTGLGPLADTFVPATATAAVEIDLMPTLDTFWSEEG